MSYADLSDYFFVWLKRMLPDGLLPGDTGDLSNPLTPKAQEIIQDDVRRSTTGSQRTVRIMSERWQKPFEKGVACFEDSGVGCVVFAHKTTEGWEALLSGMIRGGWTITGSWPIATRAPRPPSLSGIRSPRHERPPSLPPAPRRRAGRRLGRRPARVAEESWRLDGASAGGRRPRRRSRLRLHRAGARDLQPLLRSHRAENEIPLGGDPEVEGTSQRGYLAYVWEVVGRTALEQILGTAEAQARNGAAGSLEEDARLTALFLWTLQSTKTWWRTTERARRDEDRPDEDR